MTNKQTSLAGLLVFLSAIVGYQVGLSDLVGFAHDELTIIHKNLDKSCFYDLHEHMLIAVCPKINP
ncbi:hypothetical protein LRH73_004149 [Salmonella enterica]|nr:hypothetical protein [Salmonella enterica]